MHYTVYSYDPYNCHVKRRNFPTLEEVEKYFDERWERSALVKVEGKEETLIKEKNND